MHDPVLPDTLSADTATAPSSVAWFCVRSQVKHEHVAARHLRQIEQVEVFNPRLRFARPTRQGSIWITEALFPSYLFARFDWKTSLTRVHYAPGVSGVVHFGSRWPTVPDQAIQEIRALLGPDELHVLSNDLAPGDEVTVGCGAFEGLKAVVTRIMPGGQRILVLMDFLGRQTAVELGTDVIVRPRRR